MRVLFIPAWVDGIPHNAASPRIRAAWVCRYWDEAEVWNGTQVLSEFDVLVFQKAYLSGWARAIPGHYPDALKVFDLCDPVWMQERAFGRLMGMLNKMDAAVTATEPLREWVGKWLPCTVIPDRLDLAEHEARTHGDVPNYENRPGLTVVWFGGYQNYPTLEPFIPVIEDLGASLVTVSDRALPGVTFIPWAGVREANAWIKQADVALLPRLNSGEWRYKSNNKTLTAWACGVPVAHDEAELREMAGRSKRELWNLGREGRAEVEAKWDVRQSVDEWRALLEELGL